MKNKMMIFMILIVITIWTGIATAKEGVRISYDGQEYKWELYYGGKLVITGKKDNTVVPSDLMSSPIFAKQLSNYTINAVEVNAHEVFIDEGFSASGVFPQINNLVVHADIIQVTDRALKGNKNIKTVKFQGNGSFYIKTNTNDYKAYDCIVMLGAKAFYNCMNLETIEMENIKISKIRFGAFNYCPKLNSIIIPGTKNMLLEQSLFLGCDKLKNIYLMDVGDTFDNIKIYDNTFEGIEANLYYPSKWGNIVFTGNQHLNLVGVNEPIIKENPKDTTVFKGYDAKFSINASTDGTDTTFLWKYSKDGTNWEWHENYCDYNSPEFVLNDKEYSYVCCEVKDFLGQSVQSKAAKINYIKGNYNISQKADTINVEVIGTNFSGNIIFSVSNDKACIVVIHNNGESYTSLKCIESGKDNTYSVNQNILTSGAEIIIAVKGDYNLDGSVDSTDAKQIQRVDAGLIKLSQFLNLVCDVNNDGEVNSTDAKQVQRADANIKVFEW